MSDNPTNTLHTVKEAAELLDRSPSSILWALKEKRLRGEKHGGTWLISTDAIEEYRASRVSPGWRKGRLRIPQAD